MIELDGETVWLRAWWRRAILSGPRRRLADVLRTWVT